MSKPQTSSAVAVVNPRDVDTMILPEVRVPLAVRSFGLTDPGKVRDANEDQFLIAVLRKALEVQRTSLPRPKVQHGSDQGYLFVVADGMGGEAGGEKASALAIDSVETFMLETFKWFFQFTGTEEDLTAEAAEKHRWRHVITNAVGADSAEVKVEVHRVHLEAGDAVLLATDGLTNMVPDEEIARALQAEVDPERACRRLVARSNEAGGKDNITVILAKYGAAE